MKPPRNSKRKKTPAAGAAATPAGQKGGPSGGQNGKRGGLKEKADASALDVVSQKNLPSTDFIKTEKNLMSLAFFTPSNKRIPGHKKKTVAFTKVIDGQRIEARATFLPSAEYGLPITADQDLYMALLKIVTEIQRREGKVSNPISFTSAEILRIQGKSAVSGYHYKELAEQLMRIKTTTIVSEGAVFLAGKKVWARDAFNVIDRIVFYGHQLEDGMVADRNYIWFSEWQLENINNKHLLPIDYDMYKQLKGHIAKALVPLLQIWLFASRADGFFEKRYDEICQLLNISQYDHLSKIREKLGPSLDELTASGYLRHWQVEKTTDGRSYKIIFFHGDKFHRDRQRRIAQRGESVRDDNAFSGQTLFDAPPADDVGETLLTQLVARGVTEGQARKLLLEIAPDQQVLDQLEWGDQLIGKSPTRFYNPAGFYFYLVKENVMPPASFESSRIRRLRDEMRESVAQAWEEDARLELAYEEYQNGELDAHISEHFSDAEFAVRVEAKEKELLGQYKNMASWDAESLLKLATTAVRSEIAKQVNLLSFESFCERERAR